METEELQNLNVHHGHNIRRTRIEKGIKQDAMSELVHHNRLFRDTKEPKRLMMKYCKDLPEH